MPTLPAPRRAMLRRAAALATAALATAGLAACGEKTEDEVAVTERDAVTLVLDWYPNANHSAIYAAQATGAFERAGLDVTIRPPADPAGTLKLLEAGRADFVVSYEPEILLARDKGAKVQGVGALVQVPLTSMVSLPKEPIRRPEQLEGKTVGTAGLPYQAAYLETILRGAGVDPESVKRADLGFNLSQPLIAGRVDATLGMFWNYEAIELEREKKRPIVLKLDEIGVPTYNELVLTASETTVRDRGPVVRRFVQAVTAGAKQLQEDRAVGIDAVMEAGDGLDRGLQEASLRATLPVMFPEREDRPFGWQDPRDWTAYATWMQEQGLISSSRVGARAYTNEYLAGEGVGDETDS